ncbi:hypothetical protein [Paraburkholderia bannensis]|uniref:hypothetical protein n=1 Tax=Paraburkholderia bannensis TaxID=765414 RepID=UPI002ABE7745|nr:hypothetical protein [Paraburkholderia bannensis]
MHAVTILKIFAVAQGLTFGALAGAIIGFFSLPLTKSFFPLAIVGATFACALIGGAVSGIHLLHRRHVAA